MPTVSRTRWVDATKSSLNFSRSTSLPFRKTSDADGSGVIPTSGTFWM